MAKLTIFSALSTVQMILHTAFKGKRVGEDGFGNVYYRGKPRGNNKRERRWVMYKGAPEASAVPAEWHGWLHHQTNHIPEENNPLRKTWQLPHLANQTGTANRYQPHGGKGERPKVREDYTAWVPPQ